MAEISKELSWAWGLLGSLVEEEGGYTSDKCDAGIICLRHYYQQ